MPFRLHIVHESDQALRQRLDWLYSASERTLSALEQVISNQELVYKRLVETEESIMATIKQLIDDVAAVRGQADSVGTLITQLREQITGLTSGNLPADVQAQVDKAFADAEASKAELATAIAAPGTVTVPPPAPAPAPAVGTASASTGA